MRQHIFIRTFCFVELLYEASGSCYPNDITGLYDTINKMLVLTSLTYWGMGNTVNVKRGEDAPL